MSKTINFEVFEKQGRKSGIMGSVFDSQVKVHWFKYCQILDRNDVNVMPGSIPETPNPGSYSKEKKEIQVVKWGTPKNIKKRRNGQHWFSALSLPVIKQFMSYQFNVLA